MILDKWFDTNCYCLDNNRNASKTCPQLFIFKLIACVIYQIIRNYIPVVTGQ